MVKEQNKMLGFAKGKNLNKSSRDLFTNSIQKPDLTFDSDISSQFTGFKSKRLSLNIFGPQPARSSLDSPVQKFVPSPLFINLTNKA